MNKPVKRSSCQGLTINFSISARSKSRYCVAVFLCSGTVTPKNLSPSPYWPGPDLKNQAEALAFWGVASFSRAADTSFLAFMFFFIKGSTLEKTKRFFVKSPDFSYLFQGR